MLSCLLSNINIVLSFVSDGSRPGPIKEHAGVTEAIIIQGQPKTLYANIPIHSFIPRQER